MMKTIKDNVGLLIALLIALMIAIELYNDYKTERDAEQLINKYVELINTVTNHENNK